MSRTTKRYAVKSHFVGKTERLARNLLDVYGLKSSDADVVEREIGYCTPWNIIVWSPLTITSFNRHITSRYIHGWSSWESMLFGSNGELSLNQFLKRMPGEFTCHHNGLKTKIVSSIIPFSTLEELDIQLTLLGYRKSTNGIKEFASLH